MKPNNFIHRYLFLWGLLISTLIVISCQSTTKTMEEEGGVVVSSGDGWQGDKTYQMTVAGGWDRSKYYIEGEEEPVDGKEPKSIFLLRQLSKTAAKTVAIRNFKQNMVSEVLSKTEIRDNVTMKDEIVNSLKGVSIAPRAVKEVYSPRGDAEITFQFTAEGLRENVENAINDTVKRFKETTE